MHKAILSENEKNIIKTYLETGEKLPGFRVLKHRISQYKLEVFNDFHLINQFVTSVDVLKLSDSKEDST